MRFLLTAARVLVGLFFFGIGVAAAWSQSARQRDTGAALAELSAAVEEGLPTLSPDVVTGTHDGRFAYLRGPLRSPTVTDSLTGLTLRTSDLRRTVELYQWREELDSRRSSGTDRYYVYDRVWSDRIIPSDQFHEPLIGGGEHVNPERMPYPGRVFVGEDFRLGEWRLDGTSYYRKFATDEPVPEELLDSATLSEGWRAGGGFVHSGTDPDVRIRYTYAPVPEGTYSVIGVPRDGVLHLSEALSASPPIASGDVEPTALVAGAREAVVGVRRIWIAYVMVGLMILIRPATRRFRAFDWLTSAPFGRRLLMTAGLAAVITATIGALLPR